MEMRQDGFEELRQKANEFLADKALPPSENTLELIFQLLVQPAFHNHTSWTIFDEKSGSTRFARQVIWDKAFDGQRFYNPLEGLKHGWHTWPTTITHIAALDPTSFDLLLEEGRKYASSVEPQSGIVLDGVRWTVYLPGCFEDRSVTWNGSSVTGKELISWAERMHEFLSTVFDSKSE